MSHNLRLYNHNTGEECPFIRQTPTRITESILGKTQDEEKRYALYFQWLKEEMKIDLDSVQYEEQRKTNEYLMHKIEVLEWINSQNGQCRWRST